MRLLALLLLTPAAWAQTVVTGTVLEGDAPLSYATVLIVGTTDGAATNSQGEFTITTPARGRRTLEARYVGFAPSRARLDLEGDTVRVTLHMRTALLDLEGALVSADALAGTSEAGTGLTPLDVVTTPGASADLFQAVQTLSGLTQVDEGAGLFVRGGDVSETQILLDGLPLLQPYAFETPLGGTFGTVSPFLIRGTAFSTGAFSARYGDALSAVLALDSQDEPPRPSQSVSISLAAASLGADIPVADGGVRLAANQTFTDALFWVNGNGADFASAPEATNASVVAAWPDVAGGRLKVLAQGTRDAVGVHLDDPSFQGVLTSRSGNGLGLVTWRGPVGSWQAAGSAGYSQYGSETSIGSFRIEPSDAAWSTRVEAQRAVGRSLRWSIGLEGRHLTSRTEGAYSPDGVLNPDAETVSFDQARRAVRGGAWLEAETQLSRRVVAQTGVRASLAGDLEAASIDPRVNVSVALSDRTQLRLAGGVYRQAPSLETLALTESDLEVARATHAVVGVLHEQGDWTVRLEGYRKDYRGLTVERDGAVWTDQGRGSAQGIDAFARLGDRPDRRWSGWVSYSLLSSSRTQARREGGAVVLEGGPAPFDIRHSLNVIGKTRLGRSVFAGARLRVSSGRPVTPVNGGLEVDGFTLPVEGAVGSERLPAYVRLDLNLSRTIAVPRVGALVVFGAVNNVLDRGNIVGRDYAPDYNSFEPDVTAYRRSVYVGASLLL